MSDAPLRGRVLAAFVVVTLIWGSTWLVIRGQNAHVPPGWSITWRFGVASIGMVALTLVRRERLALTREGYALAGFLGLSQFFGNFQCVYRAEQHLTSGLVAVLYALLMVPNALLGRLFLGAPISRRFVAGSGVAGGGIALLLVHEARGAPPGGSVPLGIALSLAGLMCAAATSLLQASALGRRQPLVPVIAWAMLVGTLADAAFAWASFGPPRFDSDAAYAAGVAYLALAGSVVTFPLYFFLVREMGAGRAAYNGVAVPVVAMALSTAFEHYRWSALAATGAALALLGLLIALSAPRALPRRGEAPAEA